MSNDPRNPRLSRRFRAATALVAAVAFGIAGGVAFAGIPSANGTISGCVNSKGAIRIIDAEAGAKCSTNGEKLLTWSQGGRLSCADEQRIAAAAPTFQMTPACGPTPPTNVAIAYLGSSDFTPELGGTFDGQVHLQAPAPAGGANVALTSSKPNVVTVPQTVTVPAGQTFVGFGGTMTGAGAVAITATSGTSTVTGTWVVLSPEPDPTGLNVPTVFVGDIGVQAVLTVDQAPAADTVMTVQVDDPSKLKAPATVTIPAGSVTAIIPVDGLSAGGTYMRVVSSRTQVQAPVTVKTPGT